MTDTAAITEIETTCESLRSCGAKTGDVLLLSGVVYTARDAAHAKLLALIEQGEALPFELRNAVIYYAGPTDTPPGSVIGSCGPTTSSRMDSFAPKLYDMGLLATIGKGPRSPQVLDSVHRNNAFYLAAVGGAGALLAKCVVGCEVIAFPELGCEAVRRLEVRALPVIVSACAGNS